MKRLALLGASGHGKVVAELALLNNWSEVVFFDDAWPEVQMNGPWEVVGTSDDLLNSLSMYAGVVVSIGNNAIRATKQQCLKKLGAKLVTLVHPSAVVSQFSSIEQGSVVFANATVNPCAQVGDGCIVNTGAIVEHDCILGDFSHVSPNAVLAGGVRVGKGSWIGAGATIRQLLNVGDNAQVGMGAVVTKDVPPGVTVIGNPANLMVLK